MADAASRTYRRASALLQPDAAVKLGMTATVRGRRANRRRALSVAQTRAVQGQRPAAGVGGRSQNADKGGGTQRAGRRAWRASARRCVGPGGGRMGGDRRRAQDVRRGSRCVLVPPSAAVANERRRRISIPGAATCRAGRSSTRRWSAFLSCWSCWWACARISQLGQAEDPPFTFKVDGDPRASGRGRPRTKWSEQLTDRIEKKLQEMPYARFRAAATPSRAKPRCSSAQGQRARRRRAGCLVPGAQEDRRHPTAQLPAGVQGPFFNDEFGDTFGVDLRVHRRRLRTRRAAGRVAEGARSELLRGCRTSAKVDLFGVQDEKIYIEMSAPEAGARLGLTAAAG
ncbi:MAG: hypothetical protein MZV65_02245 [Chromatiales bacterium]|nr:hypothetical protein [Chromatiales bacterium]